MYNTDAGDVNKRLGSLSSQERNVLGLRCKGADYQTIADTLHIALSTVKQYMNRIYVKLGLDQLSRTGRTKALFETFCPVFERAALPLLEGEAEQEEPISISPLVEEMVEEDEYSIVLVRPQPLVAPISIRQPEPKRPGIRALIIGVVLGICLGGLATVGIMRSRLINNLLSPESTLTLTSVILETTSTVTPTEAPSQTPVVIQEIIVVTATSAPATEVPTLTPLPQPAVLFEDNFNEGLSGSWSVISGNPVVVNGQLTADEDTWIQIGDSSWVNYRVQLDIVPKDCWFSWSSSAIGVRVEDASNMNAFKLAHCEYEWDSIKNGTWIPVPNSHDTRAGSTEMKIIINVSGDQYSVDLNGERISSFFNSDFPQGGIAIKIGPETMFDNLKVTVIQ